MTSECGVIYIEPERFYAEVNQYCTSNSNQAQVRVKQGAESRNAFLSLIDSWGFFAVQSLSKLSFKGSLHHNPAFKVIVFALFRFSGRKLADEDTNTNQFHTFLLPLTPHLRNFFYTFLAGCQSRVLTGEPGEALATFS